MDPKVPQCDGKWAALVGGQLSLQWRAPRTSQLEYSQMLRLPTTRSSRCSLPEGTGNPSSEVLMAGLDQLPGGTFWQSLRHCGAE